MVCIIQWVLGILPQIVVGFKAGSIGPRLAQSERRERLPFDGEGRDFSFSAGFKHRSSHLAIGCYCPLLYDQEGNQLRMSVMARTAEWRVVKYLSPWRSYGTDCIAACLELTQVTGLSLYETINILTVLASLSCSLFDLTLSSSLMDGHISHSLLWNGWPLMNTSQGHFMSFISFWISLPRKSRGWFAPVCGIKGWFSQDVVA